MQEWSSGYRLKSRPYEIKKVLGEGGFGITYKAWHLSLDIPVVIKTPNRRLQKDGNYNKYLQDFKKEGKQLARLGLNPHPHIVRVSDLFEEEHLPCIVMDFIPGKSLYDLVAETGKLSEAKALKYIKQIGSALIFCHQAGIIHRDVHPNNIIIRNDNGKAILIDFGIAGNTQTSRNTHSGNKAFAPWEQIASWEATSSKTPQIDIYTLAASLYYLVTGEIPRECLARKYNNQELEPPQKLNPSLSKIVNQGILKGMEVNPENRPHSMQEWLDLLFTVAKKPEDRKETERQIGNTIPSTYPVNNSGIPPTYPVNNSGIPPTNIPVRNPTREKNNFVQRRRLLKYAGLIFGTIGVSIIGKKLWDNLGQQTEEIYKFDVITVNNRGEEIEREQGKAKYFVENLGNGITMDMVAIDGGTFMMGSPDTEVGRYPAESPHHQVKVSSFFMGKYQVTQAQWKVVAALPQVKRPLSVDPIPLESLYSNFRGNNYPTILITWDEAIEFCARLSKKTGRDYRLPSEAEWEYACRADTSTPFHFGDTITTDLANYRGTGWEEVGFSSTYAYEPEGIDRQKTIPVGQFPPNAFGLHDMHGNVFDMCADLLHPDYTGAPSDGTVWDTNGYEKMRIIRGGSWYNITYDCRSAYRLFCEENVPSDILGFRVVCSEI